MIYNEENLKLVSDAIVQNLTPDLVAVKFRKKNETNRMFGHCYHASACLQKIFGTKEIKLYRAVDFSETYHWWAKDNDEKVIDPDVSLIQKDRNTNYIYLSYSSPKTQNRVFLYNLKT